MLNQAIHEEPNIPKVLVHPLFIVLSHSLPCSPCCFTRRPHYLLTTFIWEYIGPWNSKNVKKNIQKIKGFLFCTKSRALPSRNCYCVYCYTHTLQPHGGHVQSCNGPPLKFIFFYLFPGWWLAKSIELDKGDLVFLVEYINSCRAGGPKWPWPKGAKLNVRGTLRKKMSTPCLLPNNNHQPVFAINRLKRSKYHTLKGTLSAMDPVTALILGKAGLDPPLYYQALRHSLCCMIVGLYIQLLIIEYLRL